MNVALCLTCGWMDGLKMTTIELGFYKLVFSQSNITPLGANKIDKTNKYNSISVLIPSYHQGGGAAAVGGLGELKVLYLLCDGFKVQQSYINHSKWK